MIDKSPRCDTQIPGYVSHKLVHLIKQNVLVIYKDIIDIPQYTTIEKRRKHTNQIS